MTIKPWREVAHPHKDVLEGTFKQSEFAADSYWFDTRPNLRREMESRKANLKDAEEVMPLLRDRVGRVFSKTNHFAGIHVFAPSADIPDDFGLGPRLVVLPPSAGYRRADEAAAIMAATEVLEKRGDAPRLKRNRLIFLAPDGDAVQRLRDAARTYLAWKSIVDDVANRRMDLGTYQADQANRFFGTVELDADTATLDFSTIVNEVIQNFTAQTGVEVKITVEIEARYKEGFQAALQRAVKENCGVLKFHNANFDRE